MASAVRSFFILDCLDKGMADGYELSARKA